VVFVLSGTVDAFASAACAHHRGAAAPHGAAIASYGAEPAGHPHSDCHQPAENATAEAPEDPHHEGCTCLGPCHAAGHAPLPAGPEVAVTLDQAALSPLPLAQVGAVLPGRPSFTLPFATAPPRSR
jgi:hypothetical protein